MNHPIAMIECLEGRRFLSASTVHLTADANSSRAAISVSLKTRHPAPIDTVTDYTGTSTNQDDKTSTITLEVTDTNGERNGVLNVNNNSGGTTPIPFKIAASGSFTFKFSVGDQKVKAIGKLSDDGQTISGSWKSIADHGKLGSGQFTATA